MSVWHLGFFTTERHWTFFTTELTEEKRRATEYYKYLGNKSAPRRVLRGARCSSKKLSYSVDLRSSSASSVVKKANVAGPSTERTLAFFTTELTEEKRRATEYYKIWG